MSRLSLCCVILAATTAGIAHSDNPGFFQPTPDGDVALTKIVPPRDENAAPPVVAPQAPAPVVAAADAAAAQRQREDALQRVETELDRAQSEANREQERTQAAPRPTVEGAFNGATGERDR